MIPVAKDGNGNLIKFTKETASEAGRKGGKASGIARRRKREMRDAMNLLLSQPVDPSFEAEIERFGIDPKEADYQMLLLVRAYKKAALGSVNAMYWIKDLIGGDGMNEAERAKIDIELAKLDIEREKLELEKEKLKNVIGDDDEEGVTIINDAG